MKVIYWTKSIVCAVLGVVALTLGIVLANGAIFALAIYLAKILFMGSVNSELLIGLWGCLTATGSIYCLGMCAQS